MNEFKESLTKALHSAVGNYNSGMTPDEAVIKAAADYDFNPDQATRLAETFNTARTIYHYKTASDRASEFPLSNPAAVVVGLFGEKQPLAKAAEAYNGSDYDISEVNYSEGIEVKAGGVQQVYFDEPKEYLDTTLDTQAHRAVKVAGVLRDLGNTTLSESRIYGSRAGDCLSKVASVLSSGYEEVCKDKYSRLVVNWRGDVEFKPVLDKLAGYVPARIKGVECKDTIVDVSDLQSCIDLMKQAKADMELEAELKAVSESLYKDASEFESEFNIAVGVEKKAEPKKESLSDFLQLKQAADGKKLPAGPNEFISGMASIAKGDAGLSGLDTMAKGMGIMGDKSREAANKQLTGRLKNVQRQIMLEDLLTNDPVLRDEDPEVVSNAYSALMQLAPEVSMNKEVTRAILRASSQSAAMSPFDAQQLSTLEKTIGEVTGKMPGRAMPIAPK